MSAPVAPASSLAHLPVGVFAIAMGVGGTAVGWHRAVETFDLGVAVGQALAWAGLAVLAVALAAYGAKVIRHPRAALAEWTHPVKAAFVATIPISMMVLAIAFLPMSEPLSAGLWWTGAGLQAIATVLIMRTWIADARIETIHVHPAWFIPVVGNLVAPLAGVAHAPAEINWYFFGIGSVFWLGLLPIVLQRLFVAGVIPPRLAPTLAILVAPPAVAALSWVRLGGAWTDPLAMMLLGVVIFQLALLAAQANALRRVPFAVSAWAYTFPLAAAASALLAAYGAGATAFAAWVGALALTAATLLVLGLGWRTGVAVARGELVKPEG
ncbi:SLAC1 anion channel family protein [Demequina sp. SYSU T00039]|uniref:SLAC1 anion channel family protein n=1 Tax=Demequina lignilytica TaxID=3051663 RepID=A0AAW7M4L2_9MICO|nr:MULTISPECIES: SLAC1 anion channel family protein [unclassified Demequina]MDN4478912.1 SLAC1 anion channel family protein [Demequina sp. SYSU T00039-1]MDN4488787.1 SLAC1 anion channel family protein [Demequina sp. SYSU T00039]MDN4491829.1 SLAC1 anion channel family protein [Demequina sp. SYSU T00068]